MHLGEGPSWQVREDDLPQRLVAALYVRDVLGLSVPGSPPPLVPAVPTRTAVSGRGPAAQEWARWWPALVTEHGPVVDSARHGPDVRVDPWAPARSLPTLQPLAQRLRTEALRWASDLRRAARLPADGGFPADGTVPPRRHGGRHPLLVTRLVAEMERGLGRRARPFVFCVDVLPVAGLWWTLHSPHHVLVGTEVQEDADRWRGLLRELLGPLL